MLSVLFATVLTVSPDPGPQRAVDLAWMDGYWLFCTEGREVSETWIGAGDVRMGAALTRSGDALAMWEQMRIQTIDGVTRFIVMPNGGAAVVFDLIDQSPEGAVFQNVDHDWPNVVVYERDGDALTATVRGMDGEDEPELTWRFESASLGARCPRMET